MASKSDAWNGIEASKVSPTFLHANSTSHTWVFSGMAELIDNAYDPDAGSTELLIESRQMGKFTCLTFTDNGNGMERSKLHKMLSFGFCEKTEVNGFEPIGQYGNGFKSGSMKLGKDAIVFTLHKKTKSCGLLSQSYLKEIGAETVIVPIVTWDMQNKRLFREDGTKNLNAITKHTFFSSEEDLLNEFITMEKNSTSTGTKIIIYNLHKGSDGKLELDFESDEYDIRNPETHIFDASTINRPIQMYAPEYTRSLREYCSILFLKPRMKIILRGKKVKTNLISKSLSQSVIDHYRPSWRKQTCHIRFGFTTSKNKEDYGLMIYCKNRLIKAYEKIGYQKQIHTNGGQGIGVVGVVEVDFLEPTHIKQDFVQNAIYNSFMSSVSQKLNDYWNEKKNNTPRDDDVRKPDWTWVQCDRCQKWRRMPDGFDEQLPDKWYCYKNPDGSHNRCEIPEEPEDEDEALKRPYEKKLKREKRERLKVKVDQMCQAKNNSSVAALRRQLTETQKKLKQIECSKQNEKKQYDKMYDAAQNIKVVNRPGTSTADDIPSTSNGIVVKTETGEIITVVKNKMEENCIDLTLSDKEDDDSFPIEIKVEPVEICEPRNEPSTSSGVTCDASFPKKRKVTDDSKVKSRNSELNIADNSHGTEQRTDGSLITILEESIQKKNELIKSQIEELESNKKQVEQTEKMLQTEKNKNEQKIKALEKEKLENEKKYNLLEIKYDCLTQNVKKLLSIVVPDVELDDLDDINDIVSEMIKVNGES